MADAFIIAILLICIGAAIAYILKARKKGVKCIGCPSGGICSGNKNEGACACGCHATEKSETGK